MTLKEFKNNLLMAVDFAKIDFKERYVGTGLGQLWYILSPIITIFIYTVIFSDFMKMKLNITNSHYSYSIYLISGLLAWTSFSTLISRLTTTIIDKSHLIKKINVPIYVYLISITITELIMFIISLFIAICFLLIINHPVTSTFFWLIPLIILQTLFAFSLGSILALFTPFFRDLKEAIPIVLQLWFWMTPIIYVASILKKSYPYLLTFNPFYYFVKSYQNIFLYSIPPTLKDLVVILFLDIITLFLVMFFYKKLISTIKDII